MSEPQTTPTHAEILVWIDEEITLCSRRATKLSQRGIAMLTHIRNLIASLTPSKTAEELTGHFMEEVFLWGANAPYPDDRLREIILGDISAALTAAESSGYERGRAEAIKSIEELKRFCEGLLRENVEVAARAERATSMLFKLGYLDAGITDAPTPDNSKGKI